MDVRFWGVRGSIAVSGGDFVRTGGNTSCVELVHDGHHLVLDGGTGLRALGQALPASAPVALLFSHVHHDHVQGVPFFGPMWQPGRRVVLAGVPQDWGTLEQQLSGQMLRPGFPVPLSACPARLDFQDVSEPRPWRFGPFEVFVESLDDHPDGIAVYRVEAGGRSVVYATDVEHGTALDPRLVTLSTGADLLVHDAQYTQREYEGTDGFSRRGWGHASWQQAVAVAREARVGRLALFHHDPARDDAAVADIEARAQLRFPAAQAAREGSLVRL